MGPRTSRRPFAFWAAAVLLLLLAGLACGSSVGIFNKVQPRTLDAVSRDGFEGDDYIVWVDCIIRNEGDSGEVEVQANLQPLSGGNWRRTGRVYIKAGEVETVSFRFAQALELRPDLEHYFPSCGAFSPTTF
jgi:hypothetical protein